MPEPLTYPPEIVIESSIELPPEYGPPGGFELTEGHIELGVLLLEFVFTFVFELFSSL